MLLIVINGSNRTNDLCQSPRAHAKLPYDTSDIELPDSRTEIAVATWRHLPFISLCKQPQQIHFNKSFTRIHKIHIIQVVIRTELYYSSYQDTTE